MNLNNSKLNNKIMSKIKTNNNSLALNLKDNSNYKKIMSHLKRMSCVTILKDLKIRNFTKTLLH
jgi:hypothetical protein